MNDDKQREARIARIRALCAKTVDNGCTEAEAAAAAAMLDKLLAEYELSMSDIEVVQTASVMQISIDVGMNSYVQYAAQAIATFTDCKVWIQRYRELQFLGMEVDAAVAEYLTLLFRRAIQREADHYSFFNAEHAELSPAGQRQALHSFKVGCAARLGERLSELKSKRDFTARSMGRDLVLAKAPTVDAAFATLGLKLKNTARRGTSARDGRAYLAGRTAADKVAINQAVRGNPAGTERLR